LRRLSWPWAALLVVPVPGLGLTMEEALARAREHAPGVVLAKGRVEEARARLEQAGRRFQENPDLEVNGGYRRAEDEDLLERETFPNPIYELPNGNVQMWLRDASNNLVEVDYADARDLAPDIVAAMKRWADEHEQSEWNRRATLFMPEQAGLRLDATPMAVDR